MGGGRDKPPDPQLLGRNILNQPELADRSGQILAITRHPKIGIATQVIGEKTDAQLEGNETHRLEDQVPLRLAES